MCIYSRDIFTIVGFCPNRTHFTLHICMIMYGYICIYTIYIIWLYIYIYYNQRFPGFPSYAKLRASMTSARSCTARRPVSKSQTPA